MREKGREASGCPPEGREGEYPVVCILPVSSPLLCPVGCLIKLRPSINVCCPELEGNCYRIQDRKLSPAHLHLPSPPWGGPKWSESTDTIITWLMEKLAVTGSAKHRNVSRPETWKSFSERGTSLIMGFAVIRCHRSCIYQTKI